MVSMSVGLNLRYWTEERAWHNANEMINNILRIAIHVGCNLTFSKCYHDADVSPPLHLGQLECLFHQLHRFSRHPPATLITAPSSPYNQPLSHGKTCHNYEPRHHNPSSQSRSCNRPSSKASTQQYAPQHLIPRLPSRPSSPDTWQHISAQSDPPIHNPPPPTSHQLRKKKPLSRVDWVITSFHLDDIHQGLFRRQMLSE